MDNATVLEYLQATLSHAILATSEAHGDLAITVQADALPDVARELRDNPALRYIFLENLCAVDYLGRDPRFEMVYHLFSFDHYHRVCLKVGLPEDDPSVPSLAALWPTATWQEREAYDLMGIIFRDHPALERILMPEDWEGHPQRKDVPLGYEEVAFSFNEDRIYAYKPFAKE